MRSFYNTTAETGDQLTIMRLKAEKQDLLVLNCFLIHRRLSPSQLYIKLFYKVKADQRPPITSIRRSLTNLTNDGRLVKTDVKTTGMYGRPEFIWELV